MTKTVQEMIAAGESEALEFKATFNKEAIESISAFANHKGGKVLLGIKDSGKVIGITPGPETIQNWINQVKQATSPSIIPEINLTTIDDKQVAIIRIDEFPVKPVAC